MYLARQMIKIFLVDDHQMVRSGIKLLLQTDPDIQVIGEAADGRQAIDQLTTLAPDIVLSDFLMPGMDGKTLLTEIRQISDKVKVVFLSMFEDLPVIAELFRLGASGYLCKGVDSEELLFGLRAVVHGKRHFCSQLALRSIDLISPPSFQDVAQKRFTTRELEVLEHLAEGSTNEEISRKLFVSKRTVEGHRQSLLGKASAKNTAVLIKNAIKMGLL